MLKRYLRSIVRRNRVEQNLDEEVRSYIEHATRAKIDNGLDPAEARRQALVEFGGPDQVKEIVRENRTGAFFDGLARDFQYAFRMIVKYRSFSALAILTIALGIGAATATFSVVDTVLLRPLPYPGSDRLVEIFATIPEWRTQPAMRDFWDQFGVPYKTYQELKQRRTVFEDIQAFVTDMRTLIGVDEPRRIVVATATVGFFPFLGVRPALGRLFVQEDERPDSARIAVLGYETWQRHYRGKADALGRQAVIDDDSGPIPYTIVGVLPEGFEFSGQGNNESPVPEVWFPLRPHEATMSLDLELLARLKPGIFIVDAQKQADQILAQFPPDVFGPNGRVTFGANVVGRHSYETKDRRTPLFVVFAASGLLFIIACGNVANLILGRAAVRQQEMALRAAIGASLMRIVRQLVIESMVLSLAGAVIGSILAAWFIRGLVGLAPGELPRVNEIGLDFRVLTFMITASVASGVLCGLTPAMTFVRRQLTIPLKEGIGSGQRSLIQALVIVGEIAISFTLLVGAGLLTQSLFRLAAVDPGLHADQLLAVRVNLPISRYGNEVKARSFFEEALSRFRSLPGVEAVTGITRAPFSDGHSVTTVRPEGIPLPTDKLGPLIEVRQIFPNYFEVAGIAFAEGSAFTDADLGPKSTAIIVNREFARQFWPGESAINKRVSWGQDQSAIIVGVSEVAKEFNLAENDQAILYSPIGVGETSMTLLLRTNAGAADLSPAINREVRALDPDLPIETIETMSNIISTSMAAERYRTILVAIFALSAMVLALVGLYGVISRSVAIRTRELGIRIAVGAEPSRIQWVVLRWSLLLTIIGIAIGVAGAAAMTRLLSSLLFGITAVDHPTYAGIAALLITVTFIASYIPARRASRIDPAACLRAE